MQEKIDLTGKWSVSRKGDAENIEVSVPGCIHTDLLAAEKIPDPFYRDNESLVQWVGETAWVYSRTFNVSSCFLDRESLTLCCNGLDTLATIELNGHVVGESDNMFRTWEFDVGSCLKAGQNELKVTFESALPYIEERNQKHSLPGFGRSYEPSGRGWIRKSPCNFGWDWGPVLVTCGIWRDIFIRAGDLGRIEDVHIQQDHSLHGAVGLSVDTDIDRFSDTGEIKTIVRVYRGDKLVAENDGKYICAGSSTVELQIQNPDLWWPNNMGEQPLYHVVAELVDERGTIVDRVKKRIGLRTLKLVRKPDNWGESFYFEVNGKPFFTKGANWIPADTFVTRVGVDKYEHLIKSAAEANMNMLRVWGGGIYEQDVFYDLCDELGICVWQDFMFACSTYPAFDDGFLANVRTEAEDNVRRLRHHPSLALWCGNNEIEQGLTGNEWSEHQMSWKDYSKLFDRMLPEVVEELDPERDYWPGSPHTPRGDRSDFNNPTCGDAHLWSVWHGGKPFEWYDSCTHRFNSEFGFQSFPEPKTVYPFTKPEDRNVTSRIMEHYQRCAGGNKKIITYLLDCFRLPCDFEKLLWLTQILQGEAIRYGVESFRRSMPRAMGTLYWQLNDCWPGPSWSSVDYTGRWKALHYMARRFYAPLLLSGVAATERGVFDVYVTNDRSGSVSGELLWTLMDTEGRVQTENKEPVTIPIGRCSQVKRLDFSELLSKQRSGEQMLWLEFIEKGETVSESFQSPAMPKHLQLHDPCPAVSVEEWKEDSFCINVRVRRPALWMWLELPDADGRFSDNFFHIRPDRPRAVTFKPFAKMSAEEIRKTLKVNSLFDLHL